eukprot:CAMPEP_0182449996 /NCGR_PEP_ID=MMETSP1172-20130603/38185_1 /TAXON_ID=708627 /ORGANISM="Timspurckia oligopyrenoides, Strain CCMP3278" /LENGTH=116 /DNA_ID=CAMNT_0024647449 /DNA_START=56 /DNA_END=402 /DNA_ORIENTATION=+
MNWLRKEDEDVSSQSDTSVHAPSRSGIGFGSASFKKHQDSVSWVPSWISKPTIEAQRLFSRFDTTATNHPDARIPLSEVRREDAIALLDISADNRPPTSIEFVLARAAAARSQSKL